MHCVTVWIERSIFKFRLVRGASHFPVDRIVFRPVDQIPCRHRTHVIIRIHFVQFTTGQATVRHCSWHHFYVVTADLHLVHGTKSIKAGN